MAGGDGEAMMAKVLTKKRVVRAVIGCVVLAFAAMWGAFSYHSVCTTCGAEQKGTAWQVPLTRITYWRTQSVSETTLSRAVAGTGLVGPHEHTWELSHGAGNGVMCAIGRGRYINVDSTEWVTFVDAVLRYRGVDEGRRWLAMFLDPGPRGPANYLTIDVPRGGFPTKEGFDQWWEAHRVDIDWALTHRASD